MASRPLFVPKSDEIGVSEKFIEFKWFPGMAASQKKKSIASLHDSARRLGYNNLLEVSSKSDDLLGVQLSAFNLIITTKKSNYSFSVESAFQASKVFEHGGPYKDLFFKDSLEAKRDVRLKESGDLVGFKFFGKDFPIIPRTFFYDWIYVNALVQNSDLCKGVAKYEGFSDIEFNPKKSINCQAHAVALFISIKNNGVLKQALSTPEDFLSLCKKHYENQSRNIGVQSSFI
ncbi:hypothetical protein DYI26_20395 [Halomonas litopenaei]|nr:hypothetical protein [Halomonas litopenaei]